MTDPSPFIWHELVTPDQKTSGAFFSQLFGWTRKEVDAGKFGTYTLFQKDGQDVAGMMNPTPETPSRESFWHSYIAVKNVDECAKQAPLLGGSVVVPPHEVPDVGRVCIVSEPMVKQRKPDAAPFQADIDDFIDQAPDGRKSIKRAGRKCAITVSIDPAVLERLDNWAQGRGISRAAAIAVAVAKLK